MYEQAAFITHHMNDVYRIVYNIHISKNFFDRNKQQLIPCYQP